jgi:G3E family GTPase
MLHFRSPEIGLFGRRQRHARGHRIPVTIVGGGAGASKGRDTAVVVDEFGAHDVMPLGNGCACCTVRAKLQIALRRLLAERAQGRHFTRVVIETSEDLGPTLRTFATERALGAEFYVEEDSILHAVSIGAHAAGIYRFVLTEDVPLRWNAFSRFVTTLMTLRGADLLCVRGLLDVVGCRGPVVVQFLQHLAHRPVELQAWPDDDHSSRVVFVTRNVEEKAVRNLFNAVRALA